MTAPVEPSTWDLLSVGLGIGASAAGVVAALYGIWRLGLRWWDRTIGRRRAQAAILDQIACTVSMRFIDSLLGVPLLVTHPYGTTLRSEYVYRLPGAWVTVEPKNDAVQAYSITIIDPKMHYDISEITNGIFDVKLGKDTFAKVNPEYHDGECRWPGNRQAGYVRTFYLGNSSNYQRLWLSFNAAGVGAFGELEMYASGIYGDGAGTPPSSSTTTVNTFAAYNGNGDDETKSRTLIGPNVDDLRRAQRG